MAKLAKTIISIEQNRCSYASSGLNQRFTEGSGLLDAIFFPFGKAGGLQILRWQVFAVNCYGFTLAALTLGPSDFYNNGVY
jgi:hypothetical protein